MINIDHAFEIISTTCQRISLTTEIINVENSIGRIVSDDLFSKLDLPPFDKSAMDGYAVSETTSKKFRVLATIAAGENSVQKLSPGMAVKIMTGAPVPSETVKVIPVELAHEMDGFVEFSAIPPNNNISYCGEDVKKGSLVISKNQKLNIVAVTNLIACGISRVEVYKQLKVAIVSTGDEIVNNFDQLRPGKIINSNGPMLNLLANQFGFDVVEVMTIKDELATLTTKLAEIVPKVDMLILSGGVSAGDFDYVSKALNNIGFTIHFDKVAIKPGKPLTFATMNNKLAFGLPGNPISAFLAFKLFCLYAAKVIYQQRLDDDFIWLPLAQDFQRKNSERTEFVPAKIVDNVVVPIKHHGSGDFIALLNCDGFVEIPQKIIFMKRGSQTKFYPM